MLLILIIIKIVIVISYCIFETVFFLHQVTQIEDSTYSIFAPNQAAMNEAKELIDQSLTTEREPELEFGAIYTAKIVEVRDIGVMVTLYPTMTPALLHNSQLDQRKVS
jgi:polyribonucleotide nucleotidyltransferase